MEQLSKADELNNIQNDASVKIKSIPFEQYFGEMEISEEDKEKRIALAELFLYSISLILTLIRADKQMGIDAPNQQYASRLASRLISDCEYALGNDFSKVDISQLENVASEVVDATYRNIDNAYYVSNDRATYIAENEANSVQNAIELKQAIENGYKTKQWVTMRDKRVRHTHNNVDGEKIGIFDLFEVGDSFMLYPKDPNGFDEEIVNCRCSLKFLDKLLKISSDREPEEKNNNASLSLSEIEQRILNILPRQMTFAKVNKNNFPIEIENLKNVTIATNNEFAIFEKENDIIIARGNSQTWTIPKEIENELIENKYSWVGHSHTTYGELRASSSDRETLRMFTWQEDSLIIDKDGKIVHFTGKEQDWFNEVLGLNDRNKWNGYNWDGISQ